MNSKITLVDNFDSPDPTLTNTKKGFKAFFSKITNRPYAHLLLCFGIPVVIMYLIYLAMQIHPFGDGSVLVLDLNAQYVYFYEALRAGSCKMHWKQ